MHPNAPGLLTMSRELVIMILSELGYMDLLACTAACSPLYQLYIGTPALLYKVELAVAGCEDVGGRFSLEERRRRLWQHCQAWRELTWTNKRVVSLDSYAQWELKQDILAQTSGEHNLMFHRIPSQVKGIEEKEWSFSVTPRIRDFAVDSSQDLLIILEKPDEHGAYRAHILSLSTGTPHPKASAALSLRHTPLAAGVRYSLQIAIQDAYVAVQFHTPLRAVEEELVVWNWERGSTELVIHDFHLFSYAFLTSRFIVIAATKHRAHGDTSPNVPTLLVVDFQGHPKTHITLAALQHTCTFGLPAMHADTTIMSFNLRGSPLPTHRQRACGVPFRTTREDFIFVCWIYVLGLNWTSVPGLLLCVPASTLLRYLSGGSQPKQHLAWDEWGPTGSRMEFGFQHSRTGWASCASGSAFVQPLETFPAQNTIVKMDFNPAAFRYFASREQTDCAHAAPGGLTVTLVNGPSVVDVPDVFISPVTTHLPYVRRVKKMEERFDMAMLCEDAIVLARYEDEEDSLASYSVLSF